LRLHVAHLLRSSDYCTVITFEKYEGAGNDFILIDDRVRSFPVTNNDLVRRMCDRHFGVGADGLMLLRERAGFDFEMIYYNSDGQPSTMCGNGGRCIAQFAHALGVMADEGTFLAVDGPHQVRLVEHGLVALEMKDGLELNSLDDGALVMDTGSPHYVIRCNELADLDVVKAGKAVRYSDRFQAHGVNVNFVEWDGAVLHIRTYERGVENETLACGTGVTAAAIAAHRWGLTSSPVLLRAVGGELSVSFEERRGSYQNVWKTGPAKCVFKGEYPT
jgi:diaminopimelate epimerase